MLTVRRFAILLSVIAVFALTSAAFAQSPTPQAMSAMPATPDGAMMAGGTPTPNAMSNMDAMAPGAALTGTMGAGAMQSPTTLPVTGRNDGTATFAALGLLGLLTLGLGLRLARRVR